MPNQVGPAQIGYGYPNPQKSIFPDPIISANAPSIYDRGELGQGWVQPSTNSYWVLTSIVSNVSNWLDISAAAAGVFNSIALPATTAAGAGVITINGFNFLSSPGNGTNTFVGEGSGNLTLTGTNDSGFGYDVLRDLTTGNQNTFAGATSGQSLTTGGGNSGFGFESLANVITGNDNIAVGFGAGQNYIGAESNNILIGNPGVAAESNIIRIGVNGGGSGQQDQAYIAGTLFSAGSLFAAADFGAGLVGELGITPVVNTTQGAGALTMLSANGNSGTNTGFFKIYVGTTVAYVPYFDSITPA